MVGRGTTPTFWYRFRTIPLADIEECWFTIKQGNKVIIDKPISEAESDEDKLCWTLTQEETLRLNSSDVIEHQIRCTTVGGQAYASPVYTDSVMRILKEGVI